MPYCYKCGTEGEERFCIKCGAKMPVLNDAVGTVPEKKESPEVIADASTGEDKPVEDASTGDDKPVESGEVQGAADPDEGESKDREPDESESKDEEPDEDFEIKVVGPSEDVSGIDMDEISEEQSEPKRKKILPLIIVIIIIIASIGAFMFVPGLLDDSDPNAFDLPAPTMVDELSLTNAGGTWNITDTNTTVDGLSITVPPDALSEDVDVEVGYAESDLIVPADTRRVSPQIFLNTSEDVEFDKMVTLSVPVKNGTDFDSVVALYYDPDLKVWDAAQISEIDEENLTVTLSILHFSVYGVVEFIGDMSEPVETGFDVDDNGWAILNPYSMTENMSMTNDGICLGMASYAKWFYQRMDGDLFDEYSEDVQTIAATRAHLSQTQKGVYLNEPATMASAPPFDNRFVVRLYGLMKITQLPQIVRMEKMVENRTIGHTVLAYAYDDGNISIYDPNYAEAQSLKYSGNSLEDYDGYTSFGIYALPALGLDRKFMDVHTDADNGLYDSDDLTITSSEDGNQTTASSITLSGRVEGDLASATHVDVYVGLDSPMIYPVDIVGGIFELEIPLEVLGNYSIFVIAGGEDPMFSSGSAAAKLDIERVIVAEGSKQILIELATDEAPITTQNFIDLANAGKYDGAPFHRVIDDFMIQGGDFTNGDGTGGRAAKYHDGLGDSMDPATWAIPDEFHPDLSNVRGTIAMANSGPDTGGSQFFINQVDNTYLDYDKEPLTSKHAVFGKVIQGMDIVDEIAGVATNSNNKPLSPVTIESVIIYEQMGITYASIVVVY